MNHNNVKVHAIQDSVPDTLFINHYNVKGEHNVKGYKISIGHIIRESYNVKGQHAIQDFYRTCCL